MNKYEIVRQAEDGREYIEIPLDAHTYIKNFTKKQAGVVFKNIFFHFFYGVGLENLEDMEDDAVKDATENTIARIKECAEICENL